MSAFQTLSPLFITSNFSLIGYLNRVFADPTKYDTDK